MPQPFSVSVIVPNYNHATYLPQRLHSILNQTYPHFEVIILDDASVDDSRNVIEQYRVHPKVVHVVYNEVNSGTTFKQWNKGVELAGGNLIWIAESDDWCEPIFLETVVKGFEENAECVLGYAQSYTVNNKGSILDQTSHSKLAEQVGGKTYIRQYLAKHNSISNASRAVFKKDVFYALSKEYMTYRFSGDWLFWTQVAQQGDVFISGKLLCYFRKHEHDVSGQAYSSGLNYLEDLRVWAAMLRNGAIDTALYKRVTTKKYSVFTKVKAYLDPSIVDEVEEWIKAEGNRAEAAVLHSL